jgi:hypothetical protein
VYLSEAAKPWIRIVTRAIGEDVAGGEIGRCGTYLMYSCPASNGRFGCCADYC